MMSCNFSFVGTPGAALANGKLSLSEWEAVSPAFSRRSNFSVTNRAVCSLSFGPSTSSACIKVCYIRCCSWFADIDQAFKLNRGMLNIRYCVGLCINRNGPLLEGLVYCSDWNTAKGRRVGFIIKVLAEVVAC